MDQRLFRNIASSDRARERMLRLGHTPNGHPLWDVPERVNLAESYPDYGQALKKLPRRTRPAAHSKAGRMGITKRVARHWDDNELVKLRKVYPHGTRAEILETFPQRTWGSICAKARSRKIYRRRSYRSTGVLLNDQILSRLIERHLTLADLDQFVRRKRYFAGGALRRGKINRAIASRAVTALGGVLRARFHRPC